MLQFTYYGHACFLINTGKEKILFDPFLTDNPLAAVKAEEVDCSYMLISHAHSDHFADAPSIAVRTGAEVVAVPEVAALFPGHSVHFHTMNIGGSYSFPFGKVTMVNAVHSCGAPGGHACGWIIRFNGGCTLYSAGDTALTADMELWGKQYKIDYAVLPIGDNFTMGPDDACRAASMLRARFVIPVHYNTWPVIVQDPEKFQHMTETKTPSRVLIVHPGGSAALDG
mgnify:FL=1|jgi:L-ascorbate metabolism protein UlaG (beta-lactamase superfamily)